MDEKGSTEGIKLLSGGKEVSKESLLRRIENYRKSRGDEKIINRSSSKTNFSTDKARYFVTEKNEILKIVSEDLCCYKFDFSENVWVEDAGLFAEFERSNLKLKPIIFEDIYQIEEKTKRTK